MYKLEFIGQIENAPVCINNNGLVIYDTLRCKSIKLEYISQIENAPHWPTLA